MGKDMFAEIAENSIGETRKLYTPEPEKLPEIMLPNKHHQPEAVFSAPHTMSTQPELLAELERMRRQYAPFLAELAPKQPGRPAVELTHFDWRLEKGRGRTDGLAEALSGEGEWQAVTLPHYEGPVGRACASYRTVFSAGSCQDSECQWLCFGGVDYRCEVYLNGLYAGSHEGFFEAFEFEVTGLLRDGENTLLVRVMNEAPATGVAEFGAEDYNGDKLYACTGLGWDDPQLGWHHCPPGMGIHGKVRLETRPRFFFQDIFVRPLPDLRHVEVVIEMFNTGFLKMAKDAVQFTLSFYGLNYEAKLAEVNYSPTEPTGSKDNRYRITVELPNVRTWSPETPWMNEVQVSLQGGETFSRRFGMRSFTQDTVNRPFGRLFLNGQSLRLRGANTMGFEQQDVQRGDFAQLVDDILLAKIANLNFWRITQRPVQPEVYDYCDRLGFMVQCDFPLFGLMARRQFIEGLRQSAAMERLIRNHPSVILVTLINEPYPVDMVPFSRFLVRAELETFFRAADETIHLENPDRIIKPVDGDYDPPAPNICDIHCYNLWYNGHMVDYGQFLRGYWTPSKPDWLLGCGEYGIEGLDFADLMRRRYPKEWLPQSAEEEKSWSPSQIIRAQTGDYYGMFYETPSTLEDWVRASQAHQARSLETMTRVFRRDNRFVTTAMHLFIDAWPSGWMKTVMDCERHAKPAFFALRNALEPLAADIRGDRTKFFAGDDMRFEFRVLNDSHFVPENATFRWQLIIDGQCRFAQAVPAKIGEDCSTFQGYFSYQAPEVARRTGGRIEATLEYDGTLHGICRLDLQFFPAAVTPEVQVVPVGDEATALLQELGVAPATGGNYLISNYQAFLARKAEIETAVARGAKAVFYNLPRQNFTIGGEDIKIEECAMNPRHFAERVPDAPLVSGFAAGDFEHWFDPAKDYIVPLASNCFRHDAFSPALWTVSEDGKGKWKHAMLAGNKDRWYVTTLMFNGLTKANPTARAFLIQLLG